jgi:D-tyrosyl-tRNA(Tyr) deacylase
MSGVDNMISEKRKPPLERACLLWHDAKIRNCHLSTTSPCFSFGFLAMSLPSQGYEGFRSTRDLSMKAVIQRVTASHVQVKGEVIGEAGPGLLILLGISRSDDEKDADYLSEKIAHLRIFEDDEGKMNRSLIETGGEIMIVSQFTLLGDCRKGRRPSFVEAAPPDKAKELYEYFVNQLRQKGIPVATGQFQARMAVSLVNDGPVTLIVESK